MIKLDDFRFLSTRIDPYELERCLFAGGPRLAVPFDADDPPRSVPIQPTITSYAVPELPAPWSPEETFEAALDRLAYANRKARAEVDDSVFTLRRWHWLTHGRLDVLFKAQHGFWLPHKDGEQVEPIATNKTILDALALGFSAMCMDEEDRDQ